MRGFYILKIEKRGLVGRVLLNGVPLRIWRDPGYFESTDQVNMWIRSDKNVVEIELTQSPEAEGAAEQPKFVLAVTRMDQLDTGGDTQGSVLAFALPSNGGAPPIHYPVRHRLTFSAADAPASELWSLLSQIDLTSEVREQVSGLVDELRDAFERKDLPLLSRLLRFKALDVSRCFYFPTEQAAQSQRSFFEGLMENPAWAMTSFGPDEPVLHLIADNRLLWITRRDFAPALQSQRSAAGASFQLPLYIANIRGRWTVVR